MRTTMECPMCAGAYGAHSVQCVLFDNKPVCSGCGKAGECTCAKDPPHYSRMNPQPIDVIAAWGLNFNLGNVIKYVARAGHKNGQTYGDDLAKAADYLAREIARSDPGRSTK